MTHISNMSREELQKEIEEKVSSVLQQYYGKQITAETLSHIKYSVTGLLHTARQEGLIPGEININGVQAVQDELEPSKVTIELPAKFLIFLEDGYDSLFAHHKHPPCEKCTFLAHYQNCDLYHCTQMGNLPTVIARLSSEPSDYISGLPVAKEMPVGHVLRVAYRIAKDEGLPTEYASPPEPELDDEEIPLPKVR